VGLAKWRIEAGDEIPTRIDGVARSSADIMRDVNAAYEAAIRRDPANWFWVHNRWKPGRWRQRAGEAASAADADADGTDE
jgi:KDO2-lipid IV(A) lauroyltransferase